VGAPFWAEMWAVAAADGSALASLRGATGVMGDTDT
jgi:hypothetical protein